MQNSKPVRVFLDSSILRIFTVGNEVLGYLAMLPMLGCPVEVVLSSYTLSETLEVLSRPTVPPKARIAVVQGLAFGMLQGGCDFIVTTDNDLLEIGDEAPIRCIDPGALEIRLQSDPDIQSYLAKVLNGLDLTPSP